MRRLLFTLTTILFCVVVYAQAPRQMSYQAVIRDSDKKLVANQTVGVQISILKDTDAGTAVYVETQKPTTNSNGLVSFGIGKGNVKSGVFSEIDWANGPYFIKTETDPAGGTNYTITGISQMLSVPYALYAEKGGTPGPQGLKGDQGDQGIQGETGLAGAKGDKGDKGDTGLTGTMGAKGDKGDQGIQGETGLAGAKGDKGDKGDTGLTGTMGAKGDKGDQGIQGGTGLTGAKGDKGDKGDIGITGATGVKGDKGDQGIQGETGLAGAKGDKGDKGDTGLTGAMGVKGDKGDKGETGVTGAKGDKGDQGIQGETGLAGVKGDKGDKGDTGLTGAMGTKGDKGDQGIQGETGLAGAKGDKGDKGDTGLTGATGVKGDKGDQGIQGTKGDTGATGAKGDKGDQGTQGAKGDKGDKGDTGLTGTTGAKGDQGIQGETGLAGAKGDKGDKGDTGITGATGSKGDKGDQGIQGETGLAGAKGDKGDKGDIGITGATGAKGDQGTQGAKGDKGDQGIQGEAGLAGAKGDKGDKGDTGLTGATGVKGDKGDNGDTGLTGATGEKGDKGDKGDQGTQGAKGDTGLTGATGAKGDQDLSGLATTIALNAGLDGKVDKVSGKGLSTEDYTTAEKTKVANLSGTNTGDETTATIKTKLGVTTLSGSNTGDQDLSGLATTTSLNLKVDKVTGKGLSTEDYTTAEKTKLAGLSSTAVDFTGSLKGDVTGTQSATVVALVGGQTAANIAAGTALANAATNANNATTIVKRDASGNFAANMITINGTTANPTDVATKQYVDLQVTTNGVVITKTPAVLVSTINVAPTGKPTIDGVSVEANDRVLLVGQTNPRLNGLWDIDGEYLWRRPSDFAFGSVAGNASILITSGMFNAGSSWTCSTPKAIIDTDPIQFIQSALASQTTAANIGTGSGQLFRDKTGATLNLKTIVAGTHINVINNANDINLGTDATNASTPNTIVARDASGNFSAGTVTANIVGNVTGSLTGNATTATFATTAQALSGQYTDWNATTGGASIANKPTIDGSETKVTAGTNITVTGSGTIASPYVVNTIASLTQVQRDALTATEGMFVYNKTTHKPNYYNGTEWMNYDGTSANMFAIGNSYQGGIIAYILQNGDLGYISGETHGIIAAPTDQSTESEWTNGLLFSLTGATGTALGTGQLNTTKIVILLGDGGYAAQECNDLVLGGYSDWYLPSKDELNKLYLNKTAVGGFAGGSFYWSSTEVNESYAWIQNFDNGNQYSDLKGKDDYLNAHVRAIRSF